VKVPAVPRIGPGSAPSHGAPDEEVAVA
jgi:hypothetical protein